MPVGNNQMPVSMNTPAPFKAVKQYLSENATASSVITLTDNTTAVEISAQIAPVAIRWVYVSDGTGPQTSVIAIAGSTANFDHVLPANTVRRFVIPIEVQYSLNPNASAVGTRVENGLFARLAYKTAGAASVAVIEYGSSNSY